MNPRRKATKRRQNDVTVNKLASKPRRLTKADLERVLGGAGGASDGTGGTNDTHNHGAP